MLVDIRELPTRYPGGTELTSAQSRNIKGRKIDITVPIGSTCIVPRWNKKILVTERYGNLLLDRCFLSGTESSRPSELIPVYMKVYEEEHANILLFIKGIKYALNLMNDETEEVYPLCNTILKVAAEETANDNDDVSEALSEYVENHMTENVINDCVSGYSSWNDPKSAGYPWDICNFTSPSFLLQLIHQNAQEPQQIIHNLNEIYLSTFNWPGKTNLMLEELKDRFNLLSCPTLERNGYDKLTKLCVRQPWINSRELFKHQACVRKAQSLRPSFIIDTSKIEVEEITQFSTELLKLCVWLHQSLFREMSFRTILPNGSTPARVKLYRVSTLSPYGVDLQEFTYAVTHLFQSWDSQTYKEVVVTKTADDELWLELIGVDEKDNRCLYVDLFYTTLLSQALIRTNIDVSVSKK